MEANVLRLRRETKFRDFINQVLVDIGKDCDEEWWTAPEAVRALERLAAARQSAVSDSLELHIEGGGNLVTAVWNGGTDRRGLERLMEALRERLEKVAAAQKPAYEKGRPSRGPCLKKLEVHFVFFVCDFKSRTALEMKLDAKTRGRLRSDLGVPVSLRCTYIVYQEYSGELARIRGANRFQSIQMPPLAWRDRAKPRGSSVEELACSTILTVPLRELVDLYNLAGDQLFNQNVRFGIGEAFDVSTAIRKTLETEPQWFWFKNNGVTLLIVDPAFRMDDPDELRLGVLTSGSLPRFSVVNGAQTITISAKYAFEQEYLKLHGSKSEAEEKLENFETAQVILRIIHVPIQAELEDTEAGRDAVQKARDLAKEISVSLNRQKPIQQEDIAFTTPFVQKLTEYLDGNQDSAPFRLTRRGEEGPRASLLNLVDFSRARLACAGQPGRARTASSNALMKIDLETEMLQNTDIFVEEWLMSAEDEAVIFRRSYGAVWFADQIARLYAEAAKKFKTGSVNAQTAVQNGKWYFTALAVQLFNRFKVDEHGQSDFSNFDGTVQSAAEKIPEAMEIFSRMAASCAGPDKQLDSNDFKNDVYYKELLEKLKEQEMGSPFKEFAEVLLPGRVDTLPVKEKPGHPKITAVQFGAGSPPIPVKSAREAFVETVCHILKTFSPDPADLAACEPWLTTAPETLPSYRGQSRDRPPAIQYLGQDYWIGGEGINNRRKFACVQSLCKRVQVPEGEISWLAGDVVRYQY